MIKEILVIKGRKDLLDPPELLDLLDHKEKLDLRG